MRSKRYYERWARLATGILVVLVSAFVFKLALNIVANKAISVQDGILKQQILKRMEGDTL